MTRLREQQGLAGAMLIVVIAWALLAVIMLTITLVSAQQIQQRVVFINNAVQPLDTSLNRLEVLDTTNAIADEIEAAAKPLSGQVGQVADAVPSIDRSAKSILDTAGQINQKVLTINQNITPLSGTVSEINRTAGAINQEVTGILGSALSINRHVREIHSDVSGILDTAREINEGVEGINRRADRARDIAEDIEDDLDKILPVVRAIDENAETINCTTLVELLRRISQLVPLDDEEIEEACD